MIMKKRLILVVLSVITFASCSSKKLDKEKIKKLYNNCVEKEFYKDKGRKLSIEAPSGGLIGNIHCKEAENIPAFKTLITFYEENPTLVKGYVHEEAVIRVNIGDTLMVVSSLQNNYKWFLTPLLQVCLPYLE